MIQKFKRGFTLIELLVVIGILAVLLAITLIAINPARQFAQANNTRRRSDVLQILNAVHQYVASNSGQLPTQVSGLVVDTDTEVANTGADLCAVLVTDFMPALPTDPVLNTANITDCAVAYSTGYEISRDAANRVTVTAPSAELGAVISVTR
jgi:type IV pilus assembly protein PilA